jgi:hypothetical protein
MDRALEGRCREDLECNKVSLFEESDPLELTLDGGQ